MEKVRKIKKFVKTSQQTEIYPEYGAEGRRLPGNSRGKWKEIMLDVSAFLWYTKLKGYSPETVNCKG